MSKSTLLDQGALDHASLWRTLHELSGRLLTSVDRSSCPNECLGAAVDVFGAWRGIARRSR